MNFFTITLGHSGMWWGEESSDDNEEGVFKMFETNFLLIIHGNLLSKFWAKTCCCCCCFFTNSWLLKERRHQWILQMWFFSFIVRSRFITQPIWWMWFLCVLAINLKFQTEVFSFYLPWIWILFLGLCYIMLFEMENGGIGFLSCG